ncbi:hypothetical protein NX059_005406 [Plenodomus lindquistii]|nr:hypothetical protein NX059_005406 [Plenodomus lindquistii]
MFPTRTDMEDAVSMHKPAFAEWLRNGTQDIGVVHREWPDLDTLDRIAMLGWLLQLQNRCAETKKSFEDAIAELNVSIKEFIQMSPGTSHVVDYLKVYGDAQTAAHAISGPQVTQSSAIRTLRLFVADVIETMPAGPLKTQLEQEFHKAEDTEKATEVRTRDVLNYLGDDEREGKAQHALQAYLAYVRGRMTRWDELRVWLADWATQCINSGLR